MARNSSRAFRKVVAFVVARDAGICGICNHGGAITADHIISARDWPPGLPGLDDPDNLQAAHGSRGVAVHNRCTICHRLCNQSKGAGGAPQVETHSRRW